MTRVEQTILKTRVSIQNFSMPKGNYWDLGEKSHGLSINTSMKTYMEICVEGGDDSGSAALTSTSESPIILSSSPK